MPTKKELRELKQKLAKENPSVLKKNVGKFRKPEIIRKSDEVKQKVTEWNFKVNQLVLIKMTNEIGLIISDEKYQNQYVETNQFFVLVDNIVKLTNGKEITNI